jgi:hypothetical protein
MGIADGGALGPVRNFISLKERFRSAESVFDPTLVIVWTVLPACGVVAGRSLLF